MTFDLFCNKTWFIVLAPPFLCLAGLQPEPQHATGNFVPSRRHVLQRTMQSDGGTGLLVDNDRVEDAILYLLCNNCSTIGVGTRLQLISR